jgi:hypothetical protein
MGIFPAVFVARESLYLDCKSEQERHSRESGNPAFSKTSGCRTKSGMMNKSISIQTLVKQRSGQGAGRPMQD